MYSEQYRHFLYGLLILGCVTKGFTKPTTENVTKTDDLMQNDDIDEYSDDDVSSVPDSPPIVPTQKIDPTNPPFFEQKDYMKKPKIGQNITLECPVKNLGDSNVILWYKEDKVIIAGTKPVGDRYLFDENDKSLSIVNITDNDSGNYYCEVQPQKIRIQANVEINNNMETSENHAAEAQSKSNIIQSKSFLLMTCTTLLTVFFRIQAN